MLTSNELERKDVEIFGLHSKTKALSRKHNDADHAAYVALKEHEVELSRVRTFFEERDAELGQQTAPFKVSRVSAVSSRSRKLACKRLLMDEHAILKQAQPLCCRRSMRLRRDASKISSTSRPLRSKRKKPRFSNFRKSPRVW